MSYYRAVILVLASNNNQICKNGRKVWKRYMDLDPTIKVFFVYGKLHESLEDFCQDSDLIFDDVEESYPVYIEKTIKAMEIIHKQITYDFFIRTNLTTFWDFHKLHLHLNELPTKLCYSGHGPLPYANEGWYLSGTDTIVTPDMIQTIVDNKHLVNYTMVEDAAMGFFFHGRMGAPMLHSRICFIEDIISIHEHGKIRDRVINAMQNGDDHYRVKTLNGNREDIDELIYRVLLQLIYNLSL